jgi:tRNA (guanine-N7-)-methyltransferase
MSAIEAQRGRAVRSFVLRAGRITEAQQRALEDHWPLHGIEFKPEPLNLDAVFSRSAPHVLEIGFGNGENLAALAQTNPERNYLGIEVHRPGVGRLLLAAANARLTNLRIICHDAVEVLKHQLAPDSLDEILILFPDPWPKKRHHKRRLIQAALVELASSRLKPGGLLRLATDWAPYATQMLEVLSACRSLENLAPSAAFADRPSDRLTTRFEKRGQRLGHEVYDLIFRRR